MIKIAVAGTGYVGLSNALLLAKENKVVALDIDKDKVEKINRGISPIIDKEIEEALPKAIEEKRLKALTDKYVITSTTNLKGIITDASEAFCKISGYSKEELLGQNHNIVRHPDMPKAIFKEVWETIASTKEWTGIVKNLRKDGLYYWVYSHISPIVNDNNIVMGYTAVRRPASENEVSDIIPKYRDLIAKEK